MIRLILPDDAMPRTIFWHRFLEAMQRFDDSRGPARDVLVPVEDTSSETNWPAYGNPAAAFMRGSVEEWANGAAVDRYLDTVAEFARRNAGARLLVVNMHPRFSVALQLRHLDNVFVADGNLAEFERALNPRTISMPALPIATGVAPALEARDILASFRGVDSHPIRHALAAIADGEKIVITLVDGRDYAGRVHALTNATDARYAALLQRSVFAFVPRGDANFSYRLLEVMSFGCIPVILSDGWVLPFDRSLPWGACSLRFSADAIPMIPAILGSLSDEEISSRFTGVRRAYDAHFTDLDSILRTLFGELDTL